MQLSLPSPGEKDVQLLKTHQLVVEKQSYYGYNIGVNYPKRSYSVGLNEFHIIFKRLSILKVVMSIKKVTQRNLIGKKDGEKLVRHNEVLIQSLNRIESL
jgi:hypothetical protein